MYYICYYKVFANGLNMTNFLSLFGFLIINQVISKPNKVKITQEFEHYFFCFQGDMIHKHELYPSFQIFPPNLLFYL